MSNAPQSIKSVSRRLEDRWLLAAIDDVLLEKEGDAAAPTAVGVDWEYLRQMASLHALLPCLTAYCQRRAADVPEAFLEQLANGQANVNTYNFFLLQELVRLIGVWQGAEVQVLAWKGPSLAQVAYPSLGLRACADLDVIVRPGQMEKAVSLIRQQGYEEMEWEAGRHTRNFVRQSPKAIVELHEAVMQDRFSLPIDPDKLWDHSQTVKTFAGDIPVPNAENLLLMLCVHGAKHTWERLSWICDLVLFIRAHPELDWDRLLLVAKSSRSLRMLYSGLLLAEVLAPGVLPDRVRQTVVDDAGARQLALRSMDWMFLSHYTFGVSLQKFWFQIMMREDVRDRLPMVWYLVRLGLTPGDADRAAVKLPDWLGFVYYLIRPFRLIFKASTTYKSAR